MIAVAESWTRWAGGLMLLATLGTVYFGLWRSLRHPFAQQTGHAGPLRRGLFLAGASLAYFGGCYLIWQPLPLTLSIPWRIAALSLGTLLYFPGLALVIWGRLTLGQMYNVSSSRIAPLYADQRLIQHGPFAYVRHPMYLGMLGATVGGLLIYQTWTLVFLISNAFALALRARREEQALAERFGLAWQDYARCVPRWIPRWK